MRAPRAFFVQPPLRSVYVAGALGGLTFVFDRGGGFFAALLGGFLFASVTLLFDHVRKARGKRI